MSLAFPENKCERYVGSVLWSLIALVVSLNGLEWSFNFGNLTLERLMVLPLFFCVFLVLIFNPILRFKSSDLFLFLWIAVGFCSSLLSPVNSWAMKMFFAQLVAISYYFLVFWLNPDLKGFFYSWGFWFCAWFMGPFLVLIYIANYFYGLPEFFIFLQDGSGGIRLKGTMAEANLYGVFIIFFIMILWALWLTSSIGWWLLILGLHLALIFSFSRAPWVAYILALLMYLFLISGPFDLNKTLRYLVFVFSFVLISFFGVFFLYYYFGDHEIIGRVHSIQTRLIMWEMAFFSISERPFIGSGIFSFSALYENAPYLVGSDTYRSAWVSNLPLAIFHDTGVIGFFIFFGYFFWVQVRGWKAVRWLAIFSGEDRFLVKIGAALVAFSFVLIVSGLSIPAHSLAFFWVALALLDCFVFHVKKIKASF